MGKVAVRIYICIRQLHKGTVHTRPDPCIYGHGGLITFKPVRQAVGAVCSWMSNGPHSTLIVCDYAALASYEGFTNDTQYPTLALVSFGRQSILCKRIHIARALGLRVRPLADLSSGALVSYGVATYFIRKPRLCYALKQNIPLDGDVGSAPKTGSVYRVA